MAGFNKELSAKKLAGPVAEPYRWRQKEGRGEGLVKNIRISIHIHHAAWYHNQLRWGAHGGIEDETEAVYKFKRAVKLDT